MPLPPVAAIATRLLDLVVAVAGEEGVALPDRRYVAPGVAGLVAWDCEQVTVSLVSMGPQPASLPGDRSVSTGVGQGAILLPAVTLQLEVVRCIATMSDKGRAPTAARMHGDGLAAMADAALLDVVRRRIVHRAELTAGEPADARVSNIIPNGPDGSYASTLLIASVTVV